MIRAALLLAAFQCTTGLPPRVKVEVVCGGGFKAMRGNDKAAPDCLRAAQVAKREVLSTKTQSYYIQI